MTPIGSGRLGKMVGSGRLDNVGWERWLNSWLDVGWNWLFGSCVVAGKVVRQLVDPN